MIKIPNFEERLDSIRDEWIGHGLSTQPADREKAERGVRAAYKSFGYEPPRNFVWVDSPLAGAFNAANVCELHSNLYATHIWGSVKEYLLDRIEKEMWDKAWDRVKHVLQTQIFIRIGHPIYEQGIWQIRELDRLPARDQPTSDRVATHLHRANSSHALVPWLAFYDIFRPYFPNIEKFDGLMAIVRNAGWFWTFKDTVILTDRPVTLLRDRDNRLHCEDGPAVLYPDGFAVWAWHGLKVDRRIVEEPHSITLQEIGRQLNIEQRRILIERYGPARFLVDSGCRIAHADEWGTLYRQAFFWDESLVMVKVVNSTPEPDGSYKEYFLRVRPDLRPMRSDGTLGDPQQTTALNAVASTFGLTGEEYLEALAKQT